MVRNDKTFHGRFSEAQRDELLIKMTKQLMKIKDRLTNVELKTSQNGNPSVDKSSDKGSNNDGQISEGEATHGESSARSPSRNPSKKHDQESFFDEIQRTLQREAQEEIENHGDITKKVTDFSFLLFSSSSFLLFSESPSSFLLCSVLYACCLPSVLLLVSTCDC